MNEEKLIPNSAQIPHVILDLLVPRLPEGEARCLLYIARRTYGFHKTRDKISLSQFTEGITTKDGAVLDYGTGLARSSVVEALANLQAAGMVTIEQNTTGNFYELNLKAEPEKVIAGVAAARAKRVKEKGKKTKKQRLFKVVGKPYQYGSPTRSGRVAGPEVVGPPDIQTKENEREERIYRSEAPELSISDFNKTYIFDPFMKHTGGHPRDIPEKRERLPRMIRNFLKKHELPPETVGAALAWANSLHKKNTAEYYWAGKIHKLAQLYYDILPAYRDHLSVREGKMTYEQMRAALVARKTAHQHP